MEKEFLDACENNDFYKVVECVEKGVNINMEIDGIRGLTLCAKSGNFITLKYLIEKGADYNFNDNNPLRIASINGKLDIINYLLSLKSELELIEMIMFFSWSNRHIDIFEFFLDKNFRDTPLEYAYKNGYHSIIENLIVDDLESSLCASTDMGLYNMVKYLVELGVDVNWKNGTPLINSCFYGHLEIVIFLVENGADIKIRNNEPLIAASNSGNVDIVLYLLDLGADINAKNGEALLNTIINGDLDLLRIMVDRGGNILDDSFLETAIKEGKFEIVVFMVEKGSNIHFSNDYGLVCACTERYINIVKYLVENGADINTRNGECLCYSCFSGYVDIVKYLLDKGMDPGINNNMPLMDSCLEGHIEIVKLLVEKGVDINFRNSKALRNAVIGGYYELVEFLVMNGAKITDQILENSICLDNYLITKFLVKNGGSLDRMNNDMVKRYEMMCDKYPIGYLNFRLGDICPISQEYFEEGDERLGCDKCLNVFKRDLLELWLLKNRECPFRCKESKFYKII